MYYSRLLLISAPCSPQTKELNSQTSWHVYLTSNCISNTNHKTTSTNHILVCSCPHDSQRETEHAVAKCSEGDRLKALTSSHIDAYHRLYMLSHATFLSFNFYKHYKLVQNSREYDDTCENQLVQTRANRTHICKVPLYRFHIGKRDKHRKFYSKFKPAQYANECTFFSLLTIQVPTDSSNETFNISN